MSSLERSILRRQRARLLGPDGREIETKRDTEIPFIRYNPSPGIKKSLHTIDRGPKVYAQAIQFMARGGRFVCQITPWGKAQLIAGLIVPNGAEGELAVVAEHIVENNPGAINAAVDQLVRDAVRDMDKVISGESRRGETLQ